MGADSFPQRSRAWGQRVLFAQRRGWCGRFSGLRSLRHIFYLFLPFSAAAVFSLLLLFSPVQLSVCDSFLDYGYFSLSFVKEREQRKSSGEAFLLPRSCPSPGSVKLHPGIGHPMPPAAPEMRCCDIACDAALTRRPSRIGCGFVSSALSRMGTACAVRTAATERRRLFGLQPPWHHIFLRHLYFISCRCAPIFRLHPPHISLSVSLLVYFLCVFHHPVLTV